MINWLKAHWKVVWWLLLVGLTTYFLWQRFDSITSGAANAIDIVLLLIWIALLTTPLFREVSLFGVSFKKEIENLKSEFEKQIISLKSVIQSTINIYPSIPPPDSELPSLEERVRPILEQTLREQGIQRRVPTREEFEIPDDTQFLFSVRYAIENELKRILNGTWEPLVPGGYLSIPQIIHFLHHQGKINPQVYEAIREVNAICSTAIHGRTLSEKAFNFVRDVAPGLLASLRAMETIEWREQKKRK